MDCKNLLKLNVIQVDLNYQIHFPKVEIDQKIAPIHLAAFIGKQDLMKLLLNNESIDIDLETVDSGYTPLCVAAISGNYEILRMLIENGAELNKPNGFNQTPFICCFTRLEQDYTTFENRKICFKMAELLLQYGADINWIINKIQGYTLLTQLSAVRMSLSEQEIKLNLEIIKFLLEHGANRTLKSIDDKTAFHVAADHQGSKEILHYLKHIKQIYFYKRDPLKTQQIQIEIKQTTSVFKRFINIFKCSK